MQLDSIQIRQDENEECSVLARLEIGVTDQETNSLDLLFFTENNLVDANPALARLKQSGILVLHCESRDIVQVWNGFSAESKRLILDKQFEVWWIRPWDLLDASGDVADQSCQVLNGAMLKSLAAKLKLDSSQLKAAPLSILERAGLQTVRKFEPSDHVIDKFSLEKNVSSAMQTADPEPERTPSNEKQWRQALRTFHLTGVGANSELEPLPGLPLWPALTTTLIDEYRLVSHYPVILHSSSDGTEPTQCVSLLEILQGTATGSDGERLGNQEDIEQLVGEIGEISERSDSTEISTVVAKAGPRDLVQ